MARQNAILETTKLDPTDMSNLQSQIEYFLTETVRVTQETRAGSWIMRSLHATPVLSDVRRNSHRHVSRQLTQRILGTWPDLDPDRTYQSTRIGVEMGYAMVEMIFDEPTMDPADTIQMAASMLSHNLRNLIHGAA